MNPVPLMRLVEVIDGLKTTKETHDITLGLCEQMNKLVGTSADFPGFISNRLLMPYINEAIYILMEVKIIQFIKRCKTHLLIIDIERCYQGIN